MLVLVSRRTIVAAAVVRSPLASPVLRTVAAVSLTILIPVVLRLPAPVLFGIAPIVGAIRLVRTFLARPPLFRVVGQIGFGLVGLRRRLLVDPQFLPGRHGDVRLLGAVVGGDGAVLQHRPRLGAEIEGDEPGRALEGPLLRDLEERHRGHGPAAIDAGLDHHARQPVVGVEGPHPDRHGGVARHRERGIGGRFDRHFRGEVGDDLDAVLHRLGDDCFRLSLVRPPGLEEETIGRMLRRRSVGIHPQLEGHRSPRQIARPDLHLQIALTVTGKINPSRVDRLVAFGDERYLRLFGRLQIPLPGDRLRSPGDVGGEVVAGLAHQERRGIDNDQTHRLAASVTGGDRELDRVLQAAHRIGQEGRERPGGLPFPGPTDHVDPPRGTGGIMGAVVLHRHDMDNRLLPAAEAADRRGQDELPAAHEGRRSPVNHHLLRLGTGADELRIDHPRPRHPPMEPRRINADARRSRDPGPRRHQPHRADQEALGGHQLIQAGQPHQRRQQHRQTDGERAVDDPVGGDVGKALRGALLQRSHDDGGAPLGVRLDEHRVDQIVVELGMLPLDRPGGVDEIHPVTDQRQEPVHSRAGQR